MLQVRIMDWSDYTHLHGEWVTVYGHDFENGHFLVWDHILELWQTVPVGDCSGKN